MKPEEFAFEALAVDYDGTIATDSHVDEATVDALASLSATGRKLLLVTGRVLPELKSVFPQWPIFDRVVAENGAILIHPKTGEIQRLAKPPPPALAERLLKARAQPLIVGEVIVATRTPFDGVALQAIRELGLEMHIVFNKGAVMILPMGVDKGFGLRAAARDLGIDLKGIAAGGDAENDHSLLEPCGFKIAVANAVPALKQRADLVTQGARGQGVREAIALLLERSRGLNSSR